MQVKGASVADIFHIVALLILCSLINGTNAKRRNGICSRKNLLEEIRYRTHDARFPEDKYILKRRILANLMRRMIAQGPGYLQGSHK